MAETRETHDQGSAERRIARVYAEALLDAAEKRGEVDAVGGELSSLVADVLAKSPDIEAALASPIVRRSAKTPILESAFKANAGELVFNLLIALNARDRLSLVRYVEAAYRGLLDDRARRVRVIVRSAVALTENQEGLLKQAIAKSTGREPVLDLRIDNDLLGGMIVQVGDKVFDSSVRTRIEGIRNQLLARSSYEIQAGRDRFSTHQ